MEFFLRARVKFRHRAQSADLQLCEVLVEHWKVNTAYTNASTIRLNNRVTAGKALLLQKFSEIFIRYDNENHRTDEFGEDQ